MSCRELTGASKSRRWCRRDRMEQISTNPGNAARQQTERDVLELFVGRAPVRSTEGPSSPVAHTSRALGLTNLKALSVLGSGTWGIVFHVVPADAATTAATTDAGTGCPPDVDPWLSRPSPAAPFPPRRCGHGQRHRVLDISVIDTGPLDMRAGGRGLVSLIRLAVSVIMEGQQGAPEQISRAVEREGPDAGTAVGAESWPPVPGGRVADDYRRWPPAPGDKTRGAAQPAGGACAKQEEWGDRRWDGSNAIWGRTGAARLGGKDHYLPRAGTGGEKQECEIKSENLSIAVIPDEVVSKLANNSKKSRSNATTWKVSMNRERKKEKEKDD
uniref:Uncharacterized protein n=1 Tax=Oryza glumipatula TaxID=40148 RepID=A0A0D9ZBA3_9ORYZ